MKKLILYTPIMLALFIGAQACKINNIHYFRSNYNDANSLLHQTEKLATKPFLKAHLKNGTVCILTNSWEVDTIRNLVTGHGTQYNHNRIQTFEGAMLIAIDSVAIFETNVKLDAPELGRVGALTILTGVNVVVGLYCLTNPKSCFGSCPTFYINENDDFHYADAEGFTNAISPSMEYADVDAINVVSAQSEVFSITMKNEALETHCVKDVKILAYPLESGQRVYQTASNDFYLCNNTFLLSNASAPEGDVTALLKHPDRNERFSLADANNLNSKEALFLTFDLDTDDAELGLIINFRQTLMTTYLFYSAMGYMGDHVGDIFSILETDENKRNTFDATTKVLGGIDCYILNETTNKWELQGSFNETGPIAINRQFIPIQNKAANSTVKMKLVLNRGLWRVDYVALTKIKQQIVPIELTATSIYNKGKEDNASLAQLNDPSKYLISMPGSAYTINFNLPSANAAYEMFVYTKGYYLEWMRENWLQDKNLLKLNQMVDHPKTYLRQEAKKYKPYEATMEQEFWNSKIDTKRFSYHDN